MAIIDTASAFAPVRSASGSGSLGRMLMTLLGHVARHGRPLAPSADRFAAGPRPDAAGPLGRHTDRWLDMMLRHRV